jgi:membrane protein YdbS with pleckstrin-like domain
MVKNRKVLLEVISVLLIPFAIFWILYRYGVLKIVDVLAVAVIIVVLAFGVIRLLIRFRVFSFRRGEQ